MKTIEKDLLKELVWEVEGEELDGWRVRSNEITDTWRWGTIHDLVVEELATGELYGYTHRRASGDGDYRSIDEEVPDVELRPMRAVETVTFTFEEIK
jgi:hypothetical protein